MHKYSEEDFGIFIGGDGKQKPRKQSEPVKTAPKKK
jgi:hypothetical protein